MPFVMMCGLPSSGKTYYAKILSDYIKETLNKNVIIVEDSSFLTDKNSVYMGILNQNYISNKFDSTFVQRFNKRKRNPSHIEVRGAKVYVKRRRCNF